MTPVQLHESPCGRNKGKIEVNHGTVILQGEHDNLLEVDVKEAGQDVNTLSQQHSDITSQELTEATSIFYSMKQSKAEAAGMIDITHCENKGL
jgi:hypothetical protein